MRSSSPVVVLALVVLALGGCPGAQNFPTTSSPAVEQCLAVTDRAAACSEQFVPMLVDVRVNHDTPKGIAEADATEGRDVLIAKARAEWAKDSVDPARSEQCAAMGPKISAEDGAAWAACLATADCAAFVTCVQPLFDRMIAAGTH